ncbi:hypothetical protein PHYBOEH_002564 [Phytophthora boehmeriae]|uniref:M96 mating-specific protein family n=1 Tax=Phytophthora boehmeriae TaxID=109152 RepID=A0A8T1WS14_9STRA|nr:hypothetical protein PHYBOEH_002564 [Phytophthora boehmeriae]
MSLHATVDECPGLNLAMGFEDFDDVELFANADAFVPTGELDSMLRLSPVANNSHISLEDAFKGDTSSASEELRDHIASRKGDVAAKRRESRLRVKISRESLRRQEKELTEKLARLKQAAQMKKMQAALYRTPTYFLWKQSATLQLHERLQAEAEQRSFLASVESQRAYIATLTADIQKYSGAHEMQSLAKKPRIHTEDYVLCNAYVGELEANYFRLDDVFRECGMLLLPESGTTLQSSTKKHLNGEVDYFQQLTKFTQPQPFQEIGCSLWKAAKNQYFFRDDHEDCVVLRNSEDTVAIKFRETFTLKTERKMSLTHRCFVRRFIETDRIAHVWKVVSEDTGFFRGVHFEETGWCCIRPSSKNSEAVVEMCQRWSPMRYSVPGSGETSVGQFCEVLQETSDSVFKNILSSMRKLSIDKSF